MIFIDPSTNPQETAKRTEWPNSNGENDALHDCKEAGS
jgi:hypothetical protein